MITHKHLSENLPVASDFLVAGLVSGTFRCAAGLSDPAPPAPRIASIRLARPPPLLSPPPPDLLDPSGVSPSWFSPVAASDNSAVDNSWTDDHVRHAHSWHFKTLVSHNYRNFGLISLGAVGAFLSFKDFGITSTPRLKETDKIY